MACWTQSLHEYVTNFPPRGDDEVAIREFLCTRRARFDPFSPELAFALRAWLKKSDELMYHHALSSALPYTEDFHRLSGSLLTWGLTRPWAKEIQVQQSFEQWLEVLDEPNLFSNTLALNMAYATRIVRNLLPALHTPGRRAVADLWINRIMRTSPKSLLWQISMYSPPVREHVMTALCDLYTIALSRNNSGNTGVLNWLKCVEAAFTNIGYNQANILLMMLGSDQLPSTEKVSAAAFLNPNVWLNPAVSRVLLPITETAFPVPSMRILHLPWPSDSNVYGLDRQERIDTNQRICDMYCPELTPLLSLVPVDWLDKPMVCRIAHEYAPLNAENFSVAGLLEPATQQ